MTIDDREKMTLEERLRKTENLLYGAVNAIKCLLKINDYNLAINLALATIGKSAAIDRVRLFQLHLEPETGEYLVSQRFQWVGEAFEQLDNCRLENLPIIMRWHDTLSSGNILYGVVKTFPADERKFLEEQDILSILNCPIIIKGELWGFICFDDCSSERDWADIEKSALTTVAAGLGVVIDKRRADEALVRAYEDLERRVYERTEELALANQKLNGEILERKEMEERLRYIGQQDSLTGLYNRAFFQEEIRRLDLASYSIVGMVVCDVDGLKLVNDFLGHDAGDSLLKSAANVLKMCFREDDIIARIGGDEFAVLIKRANEKMLQRACERIKDALARTSRDNNQIPLSLSVGYASRVDTTKSIGDIFKEADNNMYREKVLASQNVRSRIARVLMRILQKRDLYKGGQEYRLERIVANLGLALELNGERINDLTLLAQLHNYGKIEVGPEILLKEGLYTDEEFILIQKHCEAGKRITNLFPELSKQADWIFKHHEFWDGTGYPQGIKGEEIPLESRVLAVADMYDVLTNQELNPNPLSPGEALEYIRERVGSKYDPQVFQGLVEIQSFDNKVLNS